VTLSFDAAKAPVAASAKPTNRPARSPLRMLIHLPVFLVY
jgi:hypothetical protein